MKQLSIVAVLLVCVVCVNAFDFDASVSPESSAVKKGEVAHFNVTITHDSAKDERFSIYSPDVEWDVPATSVDVPPNTPTSVDLAIKQYVEGLNPGYYLVNLHVRPLAQDSVVKRSALISLRTGTEGKYLPSLRITPIVPATMDPREETKFSVEMTNLNRMALDDVKIKVRSNLFNTQVSARVDALATTTVEIPLSIARNALHQEDVVYMSGFVSVDNQTYRFDSVPSTIEIIKIGQISAVSQEAGNVFKSTKTVTFTNEANAPDSTVYSVRKPFFKGWFMTPTPSARVVKDVDGAWFTWDIALPVGGMTSVQVVTDWTPLWVILVVMVIAVIGYFVFRTPVLVEKNAVVVGTKEGGVTEIKVLIEIKNRSKHVLKNVRVLDKLPHIVHLVEEHGVGTLRPAKVVRSDATGTLLSWNLNDLDRFEARVVSYRIRTKLSIVGRLHLPVAVAKFERTPGRTRSTKSNISQIGFGQ